MELFLLRSTEAESYFKIRTTATCCCFLVSYLIPYFVLLLIPYYVFYIWKHQLGGSIFWLLHNYLLACHLFLYKIRVCEDLSGLFLFFL